MECLVGILFGFCIGLLIASKFHRMELDYKADTGVDICIEGKFYTIHRNYERENSNK